MLSLHLRRNYSRFAVLTPRSSRWGEETDIGGVKERWVVTWFKASLFTPMGVDVYSDRREGVSEALFRSIERGLEEGGAGEQVGVLCKGDMQAVKIEY